MNSIFIFHSIPGDDGPAPKYSEDQIPFEAGGGGYPDLLLDIGSLGTGRRRLEGHVFFAMSVLFRMLRLFGQCSLFFSFLGFPQGCESPIAIREPGYGFCYPADTSTGLQRVRL